MAETDPNLILDRTTEQINKVPYIPSVSPCFTLGVTPHSVVAVTGTPHPHLEWLHFGSIHVFHRPETIMIFLRDIIHCRVIFEAIHQLELGFTQLPDTNISYADTYARTIPLQQRRHRDLHLS